MKPMSTENLGYILEVMTIALVVFVILTFLPKPAYARDLDLMRPAPASYRLLSTKYLLKAIDKVEDWDGRTVGRDGERGPWQMKASTWHQYSKENMPYSERSWRNWTEAQRVLQEHASWIMDRMETLETPRTAYIFALIWKVGYGNFKRGRITEADRDYAQRAENLYLDPIASGFFQ